MNGVAGKHRADGWRLKDTALLLLILIELNVMAGLAYAWWSYLPR